MTDNELIAEFMGETVKQVFKNVVEFIKWYNQQDK